MHTSRSDAEICPLFLICLIAADSAPLSEEIVFA